jgi:predicted MPP superfamily phosphohydrolase
MLLAVVRAVWYTISAVPAIVSLCLLPVAAWVVARTCPSWPVEASNRRWAVVAVLAFGVLDWALLTALPYLGLSFGPVGLPLLGITAVRLLLGVLVLGGWRWFGNCRAGEGTACKAAYGVIALWLLNLGVLACEIRGLYVEPFDLHVSQVYVPGPALLPGRPLRIVQISDLHVERSTKREQELLQQVSELLPDVIVLTGDYLNTSYVDDALAWREARAFLAQLDATYGVYAVTARSVDTPEAMAAMFEGLDIAVLRDEVRRLSFEDGDLYLVGVSYLDRARDSTMLSSLMKQIPDDAYSLLLYHTPDVVEVAAEEGVDLYLAGHTHGGQIRLPFFGAVFTASAYGKRYEQGRYSVGETTLYVSRGLGMEGMGAPRARFLCPPEIVVVNLGNQRCP